MGQKQETFKDVIYQKWTSFKHDKVQQSDLESSGLYKTVTKVYKDLDGRLSIAPVKFGSWDIPTRDFIIELDEERHFNRYRLESLKSEFYKEHSMFSISDYKRYCTENETRCLKSATFGKNWMNDSTEKMFLKSNTPGDLTGNGSSRWRQRAYYDFIRDVTSKVKGIPVVRVSIYDKFQGKTVDNLLTTRDRKALINMTNALIQHWC